MADPLSIIASVIACIQFSERIIKVCRSYVEAVQDAPLTLLLVLVELSAMTSTFESLQSILSTSQVPAILGQLAGENGPVRGCEKAMRELEKLLPGDIYVRRLVGCCDKRGFLKQKDHSKLKTTMERLTWAIKEDRVKHIIRQISVYKTTIGVQLMVGSLQSLADDRRRHIVDWLKLTDPSPIHNKACELYEPLTGDWILQSVHLQDWIEGKQRAIWVHGIPGSGKTVLFSHLVQQLKDRCMAVKHLKSAYVYYYCSFANNQDETSPFLRWLLSQLCRQGKFVTPGVHKLFAEGVEPSVSTLLCALEEVLHRFDVAYVFIDALDESSSRHKLLRLVRDLLTKALYHKVQILATSREYSDIELELGDVSLPLPMDNAAVEHDIRRYVRSTLGSNRRFKHWPYDLLYKVEVTVSRCAKGMFRWAVCQISALERVKPEVTIIESALRNLPKNLDETYDRILLGIPEDERLFVYHTLAWIDVHTHLHGTRIDDQTLLEVARFTTVQADPRQDNLHYDTELLREFCGCLVSADSESAIAFAHYTVREYLNSERFDGKLDLFFPSLPMQPASGAALKRQLIAQLLAVAQNSVKAQRDPLPVTFDMQAVTEPFDTSATHYSFSQLMLYWMTSALLSLRQYKLTIARDAHLRDLATNLLNPVAGHFKVLLTISEANVAHFVNREWPRYAHIDSVTWLEPPKSANIQHLLYLLLVHCDEDDAEGLGLAQAFLKDQKERLFLAHILSFEYISGDLGEMKSRSDARFQGTIFDFFAQWAGHGSGPLFTLLQFGSGHYDPHRVLLCYTFWHREKCLEHTKYCILRRLLSEGADAKGARYRITALQIAVAACDRDAVEILLEAGADVNCLGDPDGIAWDRHTIFDISEHRYSMDRPPYWQSPMYILREGLRQRYPYHKREEVVRLLGKYGADTSLFFWGAPTAARNSQHT